MVKLENFIRGRTAGARLRDEYGMRPLFDASAVYYQNDGKNGKNRENCLSEKRPERQSVSRAAKPQIGGSKEAVKQR